MKKQLWYIPSVSFQIADGHTLEIPWGIRCGKDLRTHLVLTLLLYSPRNEAVSSWKWDRLIFREQRQEHSSKLSFEGSSCYSISEYNWFWYA